MDYGTYRGILTLVILVLFIVIVVWAYSKRTKSRFDDAAKAIFDDEIEHDNTVSKEEKESEK
ncbi:MULTISPECIES: cbb3-type cytochrome oxidase subunit 3 [Pseudoalteromonas]|uniref:Cbb3-type cytochrome oxidase, subunit 3 n=2 Tax=Pseudoalteromonas TaxID=53246 RepID=V4HJK6_PSEL2|nr:MULTISPECIES: cbb3-type cytochrome c oxidase subunit 3 [Pseudoalteromonas]ESP90995.1 Cbb3-type cytochrome oxidase, subunit 3 [Pseudoalteromonas luteoviolacea 2ta16]KZN38247.1 cytochrome oxidase [Pseudoalteromonas luteoviolacea NCIMB 1944]MBQ4836736.1 cbb3-type cytochrome c oxidase subunit 3 [Pseudoalteromonas luteoviolacea]MCG7547680.1 cbb3-type cytochrome c oxidase subunit 3 [Pseudoalteromonas sp. Of7M-16]MDK2595164.1 cbb3-type cytochrome c oxidase subunit 3 [Pseudoalteromonas sp. P94(2023